MREFNIDFLNNARDISKQFGVYDNIYFNAKELTEFNNGEGKILYNRNMRKQRMSFNCVTTPFEQANSWEFPAEYDLNETKGFKVDVINERVFRLRFDSKNAEVKFDDGIIIDKEACISKNVSFKEKDGSYVYEGDYASIYIDINPFNIRIEKNNGEKVFQTYNIEDSKCLDSTNPTPISYIRKSTDMSKNFAFGIKNQYDEKFYGCGESFTRLNKRGQRVNLWTYDALGAQSKDMYKPIPFFMSSNNYGVFVNGSSAMTFDFGCDYDEATTLFLDDDKADIFVILGNPKEILSEYTKITGRSPMVPDWTFGLWMSRITYNSEKQARDVATTMRKEKIPCDVIHLDTGWFEDDWKCNYKFSHSRFIDAKKMIEDLSKMGYKISLWQLPYITPTNELFETAKNNGYVVVDENGNLPTEDAIIDFSNKEACAWYESLLKPLFDMGVGAIKVDFGEGAPLTGRYASGKTGKYEHNLYPLRYNECVYNFTKKTTGDGIIWARSTWAGSQKYPIHWGGDAEITDSAMAASLRGGLSLGLCGFTFYSHDIGGFTQKSPEELYKRWAPFGMLTSHSRAHGAPPKEPWEYSDDFKDSFRKSVELKYKLMPYILEESKKASENGWPLMKTLFFEYPEDEIAWGIEDEYLFGEQLLVAPLFKENQTSRKVYLPKGTWVNYFDKNEEFSGGQYHFIESKELPIIVLVKKGAKIKHVPVADCVRDIDWNSCTEIEY